MAREVRPEDGIQKVVLPSGIEIEPYYRPEDVRRMKYEEDLGDPGSYPFTRGIHELMYRKRPWTMRQYTGFATAKDTNERFKFLIANGQTALNVAFDLPTQMCLDSDDPLAEGEVGRVGMAVDTLRDMEDAFDGVPIDKISVSLTINAPAAVLMAMYFVVAEKHGVPLAKVSGTAQNDILKEFVGRGAWVFPVGPSIRLIADTMEFCARETPRYNPVSVCGYHIRESGANAAQEMAYAFGIAECYMQKCLGRGLDIDEFAPRISFNFDIFGKLFEEVAKFRAGRRLWARLLKNKYGAKDPRSMLLRFIAGGGGAGLTIQQPQNNIMRGAFYALAAALAGCQTSALCCWDEAYTIPSPEAQIMSLRTMQIVADEVGLTDTVDPLAGSYFVETLTNQMEEKIVEHLRRIDEIGGMEHAVATGYIQREVAYQAYLMEKSIQNGEMTKVGVNKYVVEEDDPEVELHECNAAQVEEQIKRLQEVRATRDKEAVDRALARLRRAAAGSENLMPFIMDAVRAYASVGEICAIFRDCFGEFQEPK